MASTTVIIIITNSGKENEMIAGLDATLIEGRRIRGKKKLWEKRCILYIAKMIYRGDVAGITL